MHAAKVWPLTPPVALPLRTDPRADSLRQRQEPFPRATRQRRCFPGPKRLPPTNPFYPRLALALEPRPRGPPLVLRLCRLSPASDMGSRAGTTRQAPSPRRLSPELWGRMPFVDFCNFRDPRARPPIRQTPPHLRWQATTRRAALSPYGFSTSRIATAQGSGIPEGPSTPVSTSARQNGFTPTCFVRTPLVARQHPSLLGKQPRRATARNTVPLSENQRARSPSVTPADPVGPPLSTARESATERPHPRCLPPPAPTRQSQG
jgi:hypothetical protein